MNEEYNYLKGQINGLLWGIILTTLAWGIVYISFLKG